MSNTLHKTLLLTLDSLLAKAWPRDCFVCGEAAGSRAVCTACEDALPWLAAVPSCPVCALPSPLGQVCGQCLRRPPQFDASIALFAYERPVREMVLALKHAMGFAQCAWLGQLLARRLPPDVCPDYVVAMPLHTARLAARGFNQSVELARHVCKARGYRQALGVLVRDVDTPKLAGLRQKQRRQAVRGAFRCTEALAGRHVLVIDDVMTSGATLNEVARTLKQRGAVRVTNLVVARALRRPRK